MKPIIIAEGGVNHNGSLATALKLVDTAARAGADYVKFQTFKSDKLVTDKGKTADYQKANTNTESQIDMLRRLELPYDSFKIIADHCKEKGIGFLSTPFDMESIDFLSSLQMDYFKIPSGEITNLPYLRKIASMKVPVIISTGMSTLADVENALQVMYDGGMSRYDITLLHCNTQYPTHFSDVNLRAMITLRDAFGVNVGYSDHTPGIVVPVAAVALGATVIEKHFTLDKSMDGPDHIASLSPDELEDMVRGVRHVSMALGSPIKRVTYSEKKNITAARKSIVAAKKIKKGEIFSEENITVKRPGNGLSPMLWDMVIGHAATKSYLPDEPIEL
ncbi:MAG: N-acetylneuraminate synthase [Bacteroides sp.]|nr:N-acetylneuraminate synthase [Bacteroides sp.]